MRIFVLATLATLAVIPIHTQAQKKQGEGQGTFQEQCAGCHGQDGRADTDTGKKLHAADLTSETIQQQSEAQLSKTVKHGKDKMPAFENKLNDEEIKAVVMFVKQLGK